MIESILLAASAATPPPDTLVAVPEPTAQTLAYFRGNQILWIVNTLRGFAIPALFLFTGWSAKLRDLAKRVGKKWYPSLVLYLVLFTVLTALITLPLDFWSRFTRQHDYGMSNETLGRWWSGYGKTMAVELVIGAIAIWVPYLLIRKSPNRWWLWTISHLVTHIVIFRVAREKISYEITVLFIERLAISTKKVARYILGIRIL